MVIIFSFILRMAVFCIVKKDVAVVWNICIYAIYIYIYIKKSKQKYIYATYIYMQLVHCCQCTSSHYDLWKQYIKDDRVKICNGYRIRFVSIFDNFHKVFPGKKLWFDHIYYNHVEFKLTFIWALATSGLLCGSLALRYTWNRSLYIYACIMLWVLKPSLDQTSSQ